MQGFAFLFTTVPFREKEVQFFFQATVRFRFGRSRFLFGMVEGSGDVGADVEFFLDEVIGHMIFHRLDGIRIEEFVRIGCLGGFHGRRGFLRLRHRSGRIG